MINQCLYMKYSAVNETKEAVCRLYLKIEKEKTKQQISHLVQFGKYGILN